MNDFYSLATDSLNEKYQHLSQRYQEFKTKNLKLDMSRGKPSPEQLDLSNGMFESLKSRDYHTTDGNDARNYGGIDGLSELKTILAPYLEVDSKQLIITGNSSLALLHDLIARAFIHGFITSPLPWSKLPVIRFLCPTPGYDRHFSICEYFKIEMIPINLNANGPDMNQVESLVAQDETIKGIICVPKYSNPTGITYSKETVLRLAALNTLAPDFKIFWDNAYAVHHLTKTPDYLANILEATQKAGYPDRVFIFGSTSKISFAGAGIAMIATSEANLNWLKKQLNIQSIGPDKLNQLRHVRFFKDNPIAVHMQKHAELIRPKFETVLATLEQELGSKNIATWTNPNGGYFISLDTLDGCAQKVVQLAKEAGVILTNAGATFPYGKDPRNRNIRIAPTFPPLSELKVAMELLAICIQIVSLEKLLKQ